MAPGVAPALKIFGDVLDAPRFQPGAGRAIEPWRVPAADLVTREGLRLLVRAKIVLRRMAGAAMAEPGDEIAAPIPGRALALVRLEQAGLEIHHVPDPHQAAIAKRPAQFWRLVAAGHGRERSEIGPDRQRVVLRHPREIGVGERRIIVGAVWGDTGAHGAGEVGVGPGANAGVAVRRQVWGVDRAERRVDALS